MLSFPTFPRLCFAEAFNVLSREKQLEGGKMVQG